MTGNFAAAAAVLWLAALMAADQRRMPRLARGDLVALAMLAAASALFPGLPHG